MPYVTHSEIAHTITPIRKRSLEAHCAVSLGEARWSRGRARRPAAKTRERSSSSPLEQELVDDAGRLENARRRPRLRRGCRLQAHRMQRWRRRRRGWRARSRPGNAPSTTRRRGAGRAGARSARGRARPRSGSPGSARSDDPRRGGRPPGGARPGRQGPVAVIRSVSSTAARTWAFGSRLSCATRRRCSG